MLKFAGQKVACLGNKEIRKALVFFGNMPECAEAFFVMKSMNNIPGVGGDEI